MKRSLLALLLIGCSDYELDNKADAPARDTAPVPVPEPEPGTTPETTTPTTPDTTPPEVDCTVVTDVPWAWFAGTPFTTLEDPVDANGLPFWDPGFDRSGLAAVVLPDTAIPVGHDRFYVVTVEFPVLPPTLELNLQSDDGIWVWVNGVAVGQWGGDWQQEGCVNENANCIVTTAVPPVPVTHLLVEGTNHVAARVSNPVANAWFEILPECTDP